LLKRILTLEKPIQDVILSNQNYMHPNSYSGAEELIEGSNKINQINQFGLGNESVYFEA